MLSGSLCQREHRGPGSAQLGPARRPLSAVSGGRIRGLSCLRRVSLNELLEAEEGEREAAGRGEKEEIVLGGLGGGGVRLWQAGMV